MLLWAATFSAWAATATCPLPTPSATWIAQVDAAEAAFAGADEQGFDQAMTSLAEALPCVDALLGPVVAGRYHRLVGLRLFVRGDVAGAKLAFAAARAADPYGAIPSAMLPDGHEARDLAAAAATAGARDWVPDPAVGKLHFDGSPGKGRPSDRPTILQVTTKSSLRDTRYLAPGDGFPTYPWTDRPGAHRVAAAAGAGFAVLGVAAYAGAIQTHQTFAGTLPDADRDDLLSLQRRANTLVVLSGTGLAIGAIGVTIAAIPW